MERDQELLQPAGTARYTVEQAKSLTRIRGVVDPWFLGRYGMNLYRGCEHGCVYCDGRAERYFVAGMFERDIVVKGNAVELLDRELARRKEPGFVLLGGGVCDAYQPAERRFRLARGVLEVTLRHGLPLLVLTKSSLVERDFDLLEQIHEKSRVIVAMSVQGLEEEVRLRFEPGASPIARRFETLRLAKARGFGVGVMAMPVLPGISDQSEAIDSLLRSAAEVGADFLCGGGLTLRPGAQKHGYLGVIQRDYPDLVHGYEAAYRVERASGTPDARYLMRVEQRFRTARARYGIAGRVPHALFAGLLPQYAEVGVLLEHRAFESGTPGSAGAGSDLASAGFALQNWAKKRVSALGRQKGFSYHDVEAEFRTLCAKGELERAIPMSARAAREAWNLLSLVCAARRAPGAAR
jgi:DNA repair photolyase